MGVSQWPKAVNCKARNLASIKYIFRITNCFPRLHEESLAISVVLMCRRSPLHGKRRRNTVILYFFCLSYSILAKLQGWDRGSACCQQFYRAPEISSGDLWPHSTTGYHSYTCMCSGRPPSLTVLEWKNNAVNGWHGEIGEGEKYDITRMRQGRRDKRFYDLALETH